MKKLSFMFFTFLAASAFFCGSGQKRVQVPKKVSFKKTSSTKLLEKTPKMKPDWVNLSGKTKKGDKFYFVGHATGAFSKEDAKKNAFLSGLAEVSNYFGVKIKSEMVSSQREKDGEYSYNIGIKNKISGAPIKVKNFNIENSYYEKWEKSGIEYNCSLLISIPELEMNRIKKEVEALTAWTIISNKEVDKTIVNNFIKKFAISKKIQLLPDETSMEISKNVLTASLTWPY